MTLFLAAFATVFLLVFQQQNITHKYYVWAVLTSFGITLGQIFIIHGIAADTNIVNVTMMMLGGGTGVVASMFLHERLVAWYDRKRTAKQ